MALVLVIAERPSALVRGVLRNALLEPQPNVFVGQLDARRLAHLVDVLQDTNSSALVCASARRAPMGVRLKLIGHLPHRDLVELDGLQLVRIKRNQRDTT